MKLNRKLWTAALAVAMTTPSAMAAQDTAGMHYTSASEGFYASIRLRYISNGGDKDGGADIENGSSRFGVRGTNDLGSGLEGFYQYEAGVGTENGSGLSTRLGHVGLRGDFGEVVAGSFWTNTYNWVDGSTDIANRHSGAFSYSGHFGQARSSKSLQYTTPDLNGFQGALLMKADSGSDGEGSVSKPVADSTEERTLAEDGDIGDAGDTVTFEVPGKSGNKDDNGIDHWSLAAKYEIAGFSIGASYANSPDAIYGLASKANSHYDLDGVASNIKSETVDGFLAIARTNNVFGAALDTLRGGSTREDYLDRTIMATSQPFEAKKDDMTSWALKLGYSQDNWYVNSWYGEINHGDGGKGEATVEATVADQTVSETVSYSLQDSEVFSIAGGITVDKVAVYAVYENMENQYAQDDSYTTLGVQYTLGSNSWTWVEYAGRDKDSSTSEESDFSIGLGHSF